MPKHEEYNLKSERHAGHRERLRNKYFEAPYTLEDHELLEILLFYALPRRNTNFIAHDLLKKFQSFKSVFEAKDSEFEEIEGVKDKTISFLRFFGELCNDYKKFITDTDMDYKSYFREEFKDSPENTFIVISADKTNRFKCSVYDFISEKYDISDFINHLIKMQISNVVIGICKKGNMITPDISDIKLMDKINHILYDCKINVIDSLIISETKSYSLIHDGAYKFKRHG